MKHYPIPPIPQDKIQQIEQLIDEGVPQPQVFIEMRKLGLHIIDCMTLAVSLYGMTRTEAKIAIHYSEAWADMRERNEAFHETAFQAATELGFEEVPSDEGHPPGRAVQQSVR